jgi:hypothetical protein
MAFTGDPQHAGGALVVGESGMGKTRLLTELARQRPGLIGTCALAGDALVPYASLRRWLLAWAVGPSGEADCTAWAQEPGQFPPPEPSEFARALAHAARDGRASAWALDDLHLADDASAEWLLRALSRGPSTRLPWFITTQPPPADSVLEGLLEALAGTPGVQQIKLGPLAEPDLFDGLRQAAEGHVSASELRDRAQHLHRQTGGWPLLLHWVKRSDEAPATDPIAAAAGPADAAATTQAEAGSALLRALIGQALARLSPDALTLARLAAVAGQDFDIGWVQDHTGLRSAEISRGLAELGQAGLWQPGAFSHEQVRETARLAMPSQLARRAHTHVAQMLAERAGAQQQPLAADASAAREAAHWQAAGLPERALGALQRAAKYAARMGCMPQAMACWSRAAEIGEEAGQLDLAFECACAAFELHAVSVRQTQGESLLKQMKRLARTPSQQSRAAAQAAWHALAHGQIPASIELGEQALALAQQAADASLARQAPGGSTARPPSAQAELPASASPDTDGLLAQAQHYLGTARALHGDLVRARTLLEQAGPWIQRHLPDDERASYHGNLASVLDNLGQAREAREHHQAALKLTAQPTDPRHRATLLANYALSRHEAGDPSGARQLAQKALALLEGTGAGGAEGFAALVLTAAERANGHYTAAMRACDRAERLLAQHQPARSATAQLQRAHIWLDLGQHEQALRLLDGAGLPLGRQLPPRHAVRWLLLLARARWRQGEDPIPALEEARERLPAQGWPELTGLLACERALLESGPDAARGLLRAAQEAEAAGLDSVALGAWLQCALLAAAGPPDRVLARQATDQALALMVAGTEPVHVDRALRWLAPARALMACGERQRAIGLIGRGQQWLQTTAQGQVPRTARSSFLTQHPLNLLLQDLATSVAPTGDPSAPAQPLAPARGAG